MTQKLEQTFVIDAAPDAVVKAITNPELIQESESSRGALKVKVTEVSKSEEKHVYEVMTVTYSRGVGGVDKSKTDENRNRIEWDLKARKGRWTWRGPHGEKVQVTGGYDVTPNGSGSKLRLWMEINCTIMMVGRVVEKKVKEGFEKGWPSYSTLVGRYAKQSADR